MLIARNWPAAAGMCWKVRHGGTPGGFGMAFAEAALEVGDRVVLTARRVEELEDLLLAHAARLNSFARASRLASIML